MGRARGRIVRERRSRVDYRRRGGERLWEGSCMLPWSIEHLVIFLSDSWRSDQRAGQPKMFLREGVAENGEGLCEYLNVVLVRLTSYTTANNAILLLILHLYLIPPPITGISHFRIPSDKILSNLITQVLVRWYFYSKMKDNLYLILDFYSKVKDNLCTYFPWLDTRCKVDMVCCKIGLGLFSS